MFGAKERIGFIISTNDDDDDDDDARAWFFFFSVCLQLFKITNLDPIAVIKTQEQFPVVECCLVSLTGRKVNFSDIPFIFLNNEEKRNVISI